MASSGSFRLHLDALRLTPMASGHLALNITERVGWEEFPEYAHHLLEVLDGRAMDVADSVDMRLWSVIVDDHSLRLVYEDYPAMVSLESCDAGGDVALHRIERTLRDLRPPPESAES